MIASPLSGPHGGHLCPWPGSGYQTVLHMHAGKDDSVITAQLEVWDTTRESSRRQAVSPCLTWELGPETPALEHCVFQMMLALAKGEISGASYERLLYTVWWRWLVDNLEFRGWVFLVFPRYKELVLGVFGAQFPQEIAEAVGSEEARARLAVLYEKPGEPRAGFVALNGATQIPSEMLDEMRVPTGVAWVRVKEGVYGMVTLRALRAAEDAPSDDSPEDLV